MEAKEKLDQSYWESRYTHQRTGWDMETAYISIPPRQGMNASSTLRRRGNGEVISNKERRMGNACS